MAGLNENITNSAKLGLTGAKFGDNVLFIKNYARSCISFFDGCGVSGYLKN